ncbi:hypothetical protein JAAARDRAFT_192198 [Jaapia argillacea MUCL 33604]|uniref:Uncharacterized protein n=1 Tax=Jaapia argillacea MUCL 33604 TaxID=933084 RepID=A0A067PY24_9AGAM|nr:hypothetical protein JAAARDRAFT_192198 [Jaapia argillacea MUCL 33604]
MAPKEVRLLNHPRFDPIFRFIGLIVGLCVIIVVCCAAVFYLLYYHTPTPQDRALRSRQRSYHQRHFSAPSMHSFKEKLAGLFGRGRSEGDTHSPVGLTKRGQGWVQTGSGDEWESDSGDESRTRSSRKAQKASRDIIDMERGLPASNARSSSSSGSRHIPAPSDSSTSTVELAAPSPIRPPVPMTHYPSFSTTGDRSSSPPSSNESFQSEHGPISPVRTFEGGTKFKEHLDDD